MHGLRLALQPAPPKAAEPGPPARRSRVGVWRRVRRGAQSLAALAFVGLLTACAGQGFNNAGFDRPGPPNADVGRAVAVDPSGIATIALLAPIGDERPPIQNLAQSMANAAQLALNDIGDRQMRLRVYDTNGTPDGAALAAQRAIDDGAALIIGPLFAQSTRAVGPIAARAGVAVVSFSTDATVAGDNVYVIGFLPGQEVARVVSFAASRGVATFAAVAPEGDYGDITVSAVNRAAYGSGAAVVEIERYRRDFQGIEAASALYAERHLARGAVTPIQAVLLADQGQALQSLAAFLEYHDVSPRQVRFLGVSGWNAPQTLQETALVGGWFAAPDPRLRRRFAQRFEQAYGAAPHPLASLGYDAVAAAGAMVADARAQGSLYPFTTEAIGDPSGFAGVNGIYRFGPNGLNQRGLAVLEVGPQGFVVIDPAPTSFGGL